MIDLNKIAKSRLSNQQLVKSKFTSSKDLVNWMGAIQAQDFAMAKLAIGLRLTKSIEEKINASLDSAEILRTHLLRPTWHIVSSDDIYWMLNLTAPRLKSLLKHRLRDLEITKSILVKATKIIEKSLVEHKSLTRKQIVDLLSNSKIKTNENRSSHILMNAELNGIICSGLTNNNDTTYTLLEESVPKKNTLTKDESLYTLASKYFQSHSPATISDFVWWSGLTKKEAQIALNSIKFNLICEKVQSTEFWLSNNFEIPKKTKDSIFFLPAYDEYIISYKDRSALINHDQYKKVININGLFRPIIIVNGKVIGIWKRKTEKNNITIEIDLFKNQKEPLKSKIEKEAEKLQSFWLKDVIVNFN